MQAAAALAARLDADAAHPLEALRPGHRPLPIGGLGSLCRVIFGGGRAGSGGCKRPAAISIPLRVACNGWAVYFVDLALTQRCDPTYEIKIEGPTNEND